MIDRTIAGLEVQEHVVGARGPADEPLPIVLALHGRGGIPELPFGSPMGPPCRVLVPRGPFVVGDGFAWSTHYAREGNEAALAAEIAASADRLHAVIASVGAERGARGGAIVIGYSQGGLTALALAARHPAAIDELVVGAAWAIPALMPSNEHAALRIRMAHGELDDVVPFTWARTSALRMRERGIDVQLRSFVDATHDASPEMTALLAAWREQAIARAWGAPEPATPDVGRSIGPESVRARAWRRIRRTLARLTR